jgi:hypothetical protein
METPQQLTLLYTSNIRGDIHMLPQLYTFMQTLRPDERQGTLLLDLGNACADDVWHCTITQQRSALIVLDGMGYHCANVDGVLDPSHHQKVASVATMGLVDSQHDWAYHIPPITDASLRVAVNPTADEQYRLQIDLAPDTQTYIEGNILRLQDVDARQVGVVMVDLSSTPTVTSATIHSLPSGTPPNPPIVASVDFVEGEARYYQKKQNGEV